MLDYSLMNPGKNFYVVQAEAIRDSNIKHSTVNHTSFLSVLFILSQNLSLITLLPTQHTVNCRQRQDPYESCIGFLVHYAQTQKKTAFQPHKSCINQITLYTYATQDQQYIVSDYHLIPFLKTNSKKALFTL